MNGYNDDIANDQRAKLRQLFPEVFTEDRIDWARLKATLGDAVDLGERYGLGWKGKSDVFAKIQEKTVETLHTDRANSVDWDTTSNMFIEGDNLAALKILHKSYYGKVKMIYIDPPYNTGNDFVYNDDFKQTRKSYEAEAGITDDEGNVTRDDGLCSNTGGHKHSNWMSMMYPRLFLARNLLRQDGVIFVSIDDNEVHNLRLMMNEIFGEENFQGHIHWRRRTNQPNDPMKMIGLVAEHILVYTRNAELYKNSGVGKIAVTGDFSNPDNDVNGAWASKPWKTGSSQSGVRYKIQLPSGREVLDDWMGSEGTYRKLLEQGRIYFPSGGNGLPRKKYYLSERQEEGQSATNWWSSDVFGNNQAATSEQKELFDGKVVFENPKPISLIKNMIDISNVRDGDIIVDFFAGSGTIMHAAMEYSVENNINLRTIAVQLSEDLDKNYKSANPKTRQIIENAVAILDRLNLRHTIADLSRERIRRAGAKIKADFADKLSERKAPLDLGFRAYTIGESNFKRWNEQVSTAEEIRQQTLESIDPLELGATDDDILTEVLLKRGISPLVTIEQRNNYLFIPSESLAISLIANITETDSARLLDSGAEQIVLLSRAFGDDANLRANAMLQAEQRGVRVEVV
ncbi:MAG: site-specific DNA-methyltransferase [Candidatus Saccharimonas sp.]|nr:MAG: site-specific DNA-methyltransferase [Candidatus Saccharimonas sp.]